MLTYSESIRLLLSLERLGMKFGLEGITRLLGELGNPQRRFTAIHIAGTNGKGSVASMLAAIFTAAGYKTGLYTSPHLIRFEERIRIDGKPISRQSVAASTTKLQRALRKSKPTFFEATTAIAFSHFAQKSVEIAIIETGLGGRLDSTNVVHPIVSIITNIGLEHTEILGSSIAAIAREKAGIIKKQTPCVTGARDAAALTVIRKVCREAKAPLTITSSQSIKVKKSSLDGSIVDASLGRVKFRHLNVSLAGMFQMENLAIVLETVHKVRRISNFKLTDEAVREGLGNIQELSGIAGRLTSIQAKPRILVDVAHNAEATTRLVESLKRLGVKKATVVFGVMKDKNYAEMIRTLATITDQAIAVAARTDRSRSASDVAASFAAEGCRVQAALSVQEGVHLALESVTRNGVVLVTGSHFVVGEALPVLARKRA